MQDDDSTPRGRFPGFTRPYYTQVPNELLDDLLPDLSASELRCLLYIVRHTLGFQRDDDAISLSQFTQGIVKADGTVQDRGAGVSKSAASTALRSLEARGFITATRLRDPRHGDRPTTYRLRFADPVSSSRTPPVRQQDTPCPDEGETRVRPLDTQKKPQKIIGKKIPGSGSKKDQRPPLTPAQMHRLDPVQDRDLILAGKVEPYPPDKSAMGTIMVWMDLAAEWRRRHDT